MSSAIAECPTVGDLLESLGGIPPERIRMQPAPGTATEADLLRPQPDGQDRICELIDGTLVEKAMGMREAILAMCLGRFLLDFVDRHKLGVVAGADATLRLAPGLVRLPDVSFVSWGSMPGGRIPLVPIPDLAADLAVEVLSRGNTKKEMARKLREFFRAGTRLAWLIDPASRTVDIYTSPDDFTRLTEKDTLDGGEVLPGFSLPLAELFGKLDETGPNATEN